MNAQGMQATLISGVSLQAIFFFFFLLSLAFLIGTYILFLIIKWEDCNKAIFSLGEKSLAPWFLVKCLRKTGYLSGKKTYKGHIKEAWTINSCPKFKLASGMPYHLITQTGKQRKHLSRGKKRERNPPPFFKSSCETFSKYIKNIFKSRGYSSLESGVLLYSIVTTHSLSRV